MSHLPDDVGADEAMVAGDLHETDIRDRTPSKAVIDVTSAIRDVEPTSLSPLYQSVDPEALDSLCETGGSSPQPTVRFKYEGLILTVSASGAITALEP